MLANKELQIQGQSARDLLKESELNKMVGFKCLPYSVSEGAGSVAVMV